MAQMLADRPADERSKIRPTEDVEASDSRS
jgi:hypothetical protein